MQILKDEINENILESAKKIFLNSDYKSASMRAIAADAGITVGNLYRYYKNKAAIFSAIVEPASIQARTLIMTYVDYFSHDFDTFRESLADQLCQMHKMYREDIILLLSCSENTIYSNTINEVKELLVNYIYEEKKNTYSLELSKEVFRYTISLTAGSFVDVFVKLLNEHESMEEFRKWIWMAITIYFKDIEGRVSSGFLGK